MRRVKATNPRNGQPSWNQLAVLSGLTTTTITNLVYGRSKPKVETVEVLAKAGRWRALYRDAGGRRRSAGTHSHKAAAVRAAAAAEEGARRSLAGDPDGYRRAWGEWVEEWWPTRGVEASTASADLYRRRKHLDPRWGQVALGSITRADVKAWVADMRAAGVGPASVQRAARLLSVSLEAAVDAQILTANPAARLRLPGGAPAAERFLTRAEYAAVRDQLPTTGDQLVVDVLAYTGLRWGELAGLHAARVDLERGVIRVVETWQETAGTIKPYPKSRRAREVPVPAWLVEGMGKHLEQASDPGEEGCGVQHTSGRCLGSLVFTTAGGAALRNSNWAPTWREAVKHAGIGHARIHDLRHTYASWLLQAGVPLAEVGRLLGHSSPLTTARYSHLAETPSELVLSALRDPRLPHD